MKDRLGLGEAKIAQICRKSSGLLISKIKSLAKKVDWVQEALTLSDEELCEVFGKCPSLFFLDPVNNLEPRLQFLRSTFELDDNALQKLILRSARLFLISDDTIEEKLQFYSELVGEREAKRLVIKSTNLLVSASLEKRLKPRLSEVPSAGKKVVWTEVLIQRLARRTPEQWERYGLGKAVKGRPPS